MPGMQTAYEHITEENNKAKRRFIDAAANGQQVTIIEPTKAFSPLGGGKLGDASKATSYTLTKTAIGANGLSVVNKDGKFETLTLATEPANIKKLLRSGVFSPESMQNPISKMIAKIGEYKCKVAERSEEEGLKVRKNDERLDIVDFTQDCLEKLQPLLMSVNHYDESKNPTENIEGIQKKLRTYVDELSILQAGLRAKGNDKEPYKSLSNGITRIQQSTKDYIVTLNEKKNSSEAEVRALLRPHGYSNTDKIKNFFGSKSNMSVQDFIQSQLNKVTKTAHIANHGLTGWLRDTSGLAACIEEAQFTGEEFAENANANDPFSLEHGFDFTKLAGVDGKVNIDLVKYGAKVSDKLELARTISMVDNTVAGKSLTKPADKEPGVLGINFSGGLWGATKALGRSLAKGLAQTAGLIGDGLYFGGRGLMYAVTLGYYNPPFTAPSGWLRKQLEKPWISDPELDHYKSEHNELTKKIFDEKDPITKLDERGMAEKIAGVVGGLIKDYPLDAIVSVGQIFKSEIWDRKTAREIFYDATIGMRDVSDTEIFSLIQRRKKQGKANDNENAIQMQSLIAEYNKLNKDKADFEPVNSETIEKIIAAGNNKAGVAALPYDVKSQEGRDALSWLMLDFAKSIGDVFSHEIYRLHPVAGFAFTLGASMAAPMALPMLAHSAAGAWISSNINAPMAKLFVGEASGTSATVSVGLLQGKALFLTLDAFNGRESLIAKGFRAILENPLPAAAIGIAAVAIGEWVASQSIPMLSSEAASVAANATIPQFELSLIGAKVVAVLVEINMSGEHESTVPKITELMSETGECHKRLEAHYTNATKIMKCPELTEDEKNIINNTVADEMNKAKAARLKANEPGLTAVALAALEKEIRNTETNKVKIQKYDMERPAADQALDKENILKMVNDQKNAYMRVANNPDKKFAHDISQFALKIQAQINVCKGIAPGQPSEPDWDVERQAQKLMKQADIRKLIEETDPKVFTQEDKYKIMTNAKQQYPDHPDLITALRAHLYEEKPSGRLSTSVKTAMSYATGIIRGIATGLRSAYYSIGGLFSSTMKEKASRTYTQIGNMAEEAYDKTKADVGIVAKSTAGLGRTIWGVTGAALALPTTLLALPFTSLWNLVRGKPVPSPRVVYESIKTALVAPGVVSQIINSGVGELNAGAEARNLGLAIKDVNARELKKFSDYKAQQAPSLAASSTAPRNQSTARMGKSLKAAPELSMLQILQDSFKKTHSLYKIIDGKGRLKDALEAITKSIIENNEKIEKKSSVTKFFSSDTQQDQMTQTLRELHDVIGQPGVIKDPKNRNLFQSHIDMLQQINQVDPIIELNKAYSGFLSSTKLSVNAPRLGELTVFHDNLAKAITSLTAFSASPQALNREKAVLDLLTNNPCISLKESFSAMIEIKKIIAKLETTRGAPKDKAKNADTRNQLADAKNLLRAYERVYVAAQQTNSKLAIYGKIVDKLAGLDGIDPTLFAAEIAEKKIKLDGRLSQTLSDGIKPAASIVTPASPSIKPDSNLDESKLSSSASSSDSDSDISQSSPEISRSVSTSSSDASFHPPHLRRHSISQSDSSVDDEKHEDPYSSIVSTSSSDSSHSNLFSPRSPLSVTAGSALTLTSVRVASSKQQQPLVLEEEKTQEHTITLAYVEKLLENCATNLSAREDLIHMRVISPPPRNLGTIPAPIKIRDEWIEALGGKDNKAVKNFNPEAKIIVTPPKGWKSDSTDITASNRTFYHETKKDLHIHQNYQQAKTEVTFDTASIADGSIAKDIHDALYLHTCEFGTNKAISIGKDTYPEEVVRTTIALCKAYNLPIMFDQSDKVFADKCEKYACSPACFKKIEKIKQDPNIGMLSPIGNKIPVDQLKSTADECLKQTAVAVRPLTTILIGAPVDPRSSSRVVR
jgi:hypothetical protein